MIALKYVKEYSDKKQLKALAMFMFIKLKYKNSVVFNYNLSKLSDIVGLSINTTKKYVDILTENEHVYMHSGNLCFKKLKSSNRAENVVFHRVLAQRKQNNKLSIKDIEALLYSELLRYEGDQQLYIVDQKLMMNSSPNNNTSVTSYKRAKDKLQRLGYVKDDDALQVDINNDLTFTIETIKKITGIKSNDKLYDVMKIWERYKIVSIKRFKPEFVKKASYKGEVECMKESGAKVWRDGQYVTIRESQGFFMTSRGHICLQKPNQYKFRTSFCTNSTAGRYKNRRPIFDRYAENRLLIR